MACQGQRRGRCGAASARATKEAPSANGRTRSPTFVACSARWPCWAGVIAAQRRGAHPSASRRQQALGAVTKQAAQVFRSCAPRAGKASAARDISLRQARDRSPRVLTSGATLAPTRRHTGCSSALLSASSSLVGAHDRARLLTPRTGAGRLRFPSTSPQPNSPKPVPLAPHSCGSLPGALLQHRCLLGVGHGEQPRVQSREPRGLCAVPRGRTETRLSRPRLPVARPGHAGALR